MYDDLDEEQKQTTFKNLIQEHVEHNHIYEEINLLLYDFNFEPDIKIISWLKKKKYQDILEIIEKRNLFFKLNQEFKDIDNHQKITTIKI